jgi:hypothetical protein
MKNLTPLFYLTWLFFVSVGLMAEQTQFSKFGYPENSILYGPKAGSTFFFKQVEGQDFQDGKIHLEIIASQVINKEISTITFLIADHPIYSSFLKDLGDTIKIDLPVIQEQLQSGFIKLEIRSNLFLNHEVCRNIDEPALWRKVTERSFFEESIAQRNKTKPNWKIDKFISTIDQLIIPKSTMNQNVDLVSQLHYFFKRNYQKNLKISYLEDVEIADLNRAIVFGTGKELTSQFHKEKDLGKNPNQGELRIAYSQYLDSASQDSLYASSLLLTGGDKNGLEKAVLFLFSQDLISAAFTDQVTVLGILESDSVFQSELKETFTFLDLGFDVEKASGMGKIITNLLIPRYLTKSNLRSLALHLKINHKPISQNESGFANIYINNDLIGSYKLNESGIFDEYIFTNRVRFATGSFISIEYIYIPDGGLCNSNASEFYSQINTLESTLSPAYFSNPPLTFNSFPLNFSGAPIEIIYDYDISKFDISAISDLISLINIRFESNSKAYFPKFRKMDSVQKLLENNSNKLFLTKTPAAYNSILQKNQYISFYGDSISFRSDDIPHFFDLSFKDEFAFLQLFEHRGNKIFMINDLSENHKALQNALLGMKDQYFTNSGNVMISNGERYYFFDLRSTELKNKTDNTKNSFNDFWGRFRVFIILIGVALVITLLSYIFNKSKIAKKNIEDAR